VLESLVKRVEKSHEKVQLQQPAQIEEDGRPYVDQKNSKTNGVRRANAFRTRGLPCKEWLVEKDVSLLKATDMEAEVRASIKALRELTQARKQMHAQQRAAQHATFAETALDQQAGVLKPSPHKHQQMPRLQWVSPDHYDGNWSTLHIRLK